jgi:hypothetical protein
MEVKITVKYHSNSNGMGKLRAKGGGRQVTIGYPHELHHSMKYFSAASALADKIERKEDVRLRLVSRKFVDSCMASATSETFVYEVWDNAGPRFGNWDAVKYDRLPAGYQTALR